MKKQILLSIALTFILAFGVKADPGTVTVTIADVIEQPGTVNIPVYIEVPDVVENSPGVGSIELTIDYNTNVLTEYLAVTNISEELEDWNKAWGVGEDIDDGEIKINLTSADETEANYLKDYSGVLFDLQFEYAGGITAITFIGPNEDGVSQIGGDVQIRDATPITATFNDGSITQAPPIPIALWSLLVGFGLISLFTLKRTARNR